MNDNDILREDLITGMMSRPTRAEAEVIAMRIAASISNVIDEKIESYVGEDNMEDYADV